MYNGAATLDWSAPTTNADGSFLNDLAGYRVYQSLTSRAQSTEGLAMTDVGLARTLTVTNLAHNTRYFFSVTAYDINNNESTYSAEVSKLVIVSTLQLLRRFV